MPLPTGGFAFRNKTYIVHKHREFAHNYDVIKENSVMRKPARFLDSAFWNKHDISSFTM